MTDTNNNPGGAGADPGASALLDSGPLSVAAEGLTRAEILAELGEIQKIARPTQEQLERGLALRAIAMRPNMTAFGPTVTVPETMKAVADQQQAIAEVEKESSVSTFQRIYGVDERFSNHQRHDLMATPIEYELAGPEREACMSDPEFIKRYQSNSRERIYGLGGPNDQKFTARAWLATLNLVLISKVAK